MGCGCGNKAKKTVASAPSIAERVQSSEPTMFDVIGPDGTVLTSSTNPTFARVEARRMGGTVVPRATASASQV